MSFQGDVKGIGLAELLQGLARGRKEGILTLSASGQRRTTLGLEEGKAYLLPDENEDAERWRSRARDAWADDMRVDYLRMSEIARAQRLEDLYRLLDGGDVHFRFEPGAIPKGSPELGEEADARTQVFCDGLQVEFLLLEYARIADELEGSVLAQEMPIDAIPTVLDPALVAGAPMRFLEQCDGRSTLQEIADRLSLPVRQACLNAGPLVQTGGMRLAQPMETLHLALGELGQKRVARAAVRLAAWCRDGAPGPLPVDVATALDSEWLGGRLGGALRLLTGRDRRTILRRLDHSLQNPSQTVVHWIEATRIHKDDNIARLKRMVAEYREGTNPDAPTVRELLDWARGVRDDGRPWRAAPALVLAALRQPTSSPLQLELGTGLVEAGRPLEGAPWVIAGSRDLLEAGQADRAVVPLRSLLAGDPSNRECRQLLTRARRQSTQVKKLRKNLLIGLGLAGLAAGAAVVKVHVETEREGQLDQVRLLLHNPAQALAQLEESFGGDVSEEVRDLRDQIEERQRTDEYEQRTEWMAIYNDAQLEATKGDPLAALGKIRAIPAPPSLRLVRDPWPSADDLYQAITDTLEYELTALGEPIENSPGQSEREDQIDHWCETLREMLAAEPVNPRAPLAKVYEDFDGALDGLQITIAERRSIRDTKRDQREASERITRQDELFRKGEAYAAKGDLVRALRAWEDCIATDDSGRVKELLAERMERVRGQLDAMAEARTLAQEGDHDQAITLLEENLEDPSDVILPWQVTSFPEEVTARQGEREWTTPFVIETTLGESIELTFEAPGYEPRKVRFEGPRDRHVDLERSPERRWNAPAQVDAVPVPVGDDHLVCDRNGNLARIGAGGKEHWQVQVRCLSGIARAPVFLPQRPNALVVVTEDGEAWIVDAETGALEGPWPLGSPPVLGPIADAETVSVLLADGRQVTFARTLEPVSDKPATDKLGERFGTTSGMEVRRHSFGDLPADQTADFACPWRPWAVTPKPGAYLVEPTTEGAGEEAYSILASGDWRFLAWEAPTPSAPLGRLWVSDDGGVRAYVPHGE